MTREELISRLRWELSDEQVLRAFVACPDCGRHIPLGVAFRLAEDCISFDEWIKRLNDYINALPSREITGAQCQALAWASAERRPHNN